MRGQYWPAGVPLDPIRLVPLTDYHRPLTKRTALRFMANYSEQFLLLSVDPDTGRFFPLADQALHLTLAGSLLLDASFRGVINDDWTHLTVLKPEQTGFPALDEALRCLSFIEGAIPLDQAITLIAAHGETLREMVLDSLREQGLLTERRQGFLAGMHGELRFSPDLPLVVGIHRNLRDAILQDDLPDHRIPALVSLMVAGGLTRYVLKPDAADRREARIALLAGIEPLGREIIRAVRALESTDLERDAAAIVGLQHDQPKTFAGGIDAVLTSLAFLHKETGLNRTRKLIANLNQVHGFGCPGCAWPNPGHKRSRFEFCENGAKNVSAEATRRLLEPAFFAKWSVSDLLLTSDYWLEQQGRLAQPMLLEEDAGHYRPVSWEEAFQTIAREMRELTHPDEAVFYASGRTSNEAAFLYQLLARAWGTNNLPSSSNLCHEPSGMALSASLGNGKGSVTLEDFARADAIFLFGHNPGSNHPRMLRSLQEAARSGCRIVAVNPMCEASLLAFADPQEVRSYLGMRTRVAQLYLQPTVNGDMALVRGMVKAVLEAEESRGGIIDRRFLEDHTSGFGAYQRLVANTPWDRLIAASGIDERQMREAAQIYCEAGSVIAGWCLGITHHRNAIDTIREIVNLLLLRGNVGKPGTGVLPLRGHSNIQGIRTAGVGDNMPASFLDSLEQHFSIPVPRTPGMSAVPAIRAMADGRVKVLFSLGGNLAAAAPDTDFTAQALRNCRMTVMISTKLNRSHLVTGRRALILPCLARTDEELQAGAPLSVTIEDLTGKVGLSRGCLTPPSPNLKSEVSIVAEMAAAVLSGGPRIDWYRLGKERPFLRQTMYQVIPAFQGLCEVETRPVEVLLDNPLRQRKFRTADGKAQFSQSELNRVDVEQDELLLMTVRSHDQFNTTIFGLNDRYRGIRNERRVLFMNPADMVERQIAPEQTVEITSQYDGRLRKLGGYYAIPTQIQQGCAAAYFPEANVLTSINSTVPGCETPAYKSVRVKVRRET
jgi:molybdopterin-dependent oxidoreductase alpha subunit